MQEAVFSEIADLALKGSGQSLHASKAYLIEARLSHIVRREGFGSMDDLVNCLKARPNPQLQTEVVSALTSKETCFFRERAGFETLVSDYLPQRLANGRVRIWCAGVATGEEVYSLALLCAERGLTADAAGHRIEFVATDVSKAALQKAQTGTYNHYQIQRGLSIQRLLANFEKQNSGDWQIADAVRGQIGFRVHNLLESAAGLGKFDIILCRNVLTGMARGARARVTENLAEVLAPGGMLLTGGTESLYGLSARLEPAGERYPVTWTSAGAAQAASAA